MTALVVLLGVAIALLGVLVLGLLRSHAEILRRLHELGVGTEEPSGAAVTSPRRWSPPADPATGSGKTARDVVGQTPVGETAAIGVAGAPHDTLIAFLSSGCLTCAKFWRALASSTEDLGLPPGVRPLIVTKSADAESVSAIGPLAPANVTVVMSTQAWLDYVVPGAPYFVLVDGPDGTVATEGTATTWSEVNRLVATATGGHEGDAGAPPPTGPRPQVIDPDARHVVDAELLAAGIGPGHPSLYTDQPPRPAAGEGEKGEEAET
jgi:hypothetical protein